VVRILRKAEVLLEQVIDAMLLLHKHIFSKWAFKGLDVCSTMRS
jgi:hypothetical protein